MPGTDQRLALVTGTSRGIGRASATALTEAGFRCIGLDLDPSEADWPSYACDLADIQRSRQLLERIAKDHGVPDVLINCAGIVRHKAFFDVTPEDYDSTMGINARGLFFLTQGTARMMVDAKKPGSIVHIASAGPFVGTGDPAYGMSKGAVVALTKSMARALAPYRIRVNAIAPGLVDTRMTESMSVEVRERYNAVIPLNHLGAPEDIANAIVFLASDKSRYMTGTTVHVNGGMY